MSLNVYIDYETCPHCGRSDDCPYLNITHNLVAMAEEAGLYKYMWEAGGMKTHDVLPKLVEGYMKLIKEPEKFKLFNPPNGWGTYEGLVEFVEMYIKACAQPGTIRISK